MSHFLFAFFLGSSWSCAGTLLPTWSRLGSGQHPYHPHKDLLDLRACRLLKASLGSWVWWYMAAIPEETGLELKAVHVGDSKISQGASVNSACLVCERSWALGTACPNHSNQRPSPRTLVVRGLLSKPSQDQVSQPCLPRLLLSLHLSMGKPANPTDQRRQAQSPLNTKHQRVTCMGLSSSPNDPSASFLDSISVCSLDWTQTLRLKVLTLTFIVGGVTRARSEFLASCDLLVSVCSYLYSVRPRRNSG